MKLFIRQNKKGKIKSSVQVEDVRNGFIIDSEEGVDVVEIKDTEERYDCEAIQKMLYLVLEHMGIYGSKHDKHRVFIEIRKQGD